MDPATISTILGIAGQATGTLGGAIDVVKRLRGAEKSEITQEELRDLAGELAEQLYHARMNNLEIVTELQKLQRTVEVEDRFQKTLDNYRPKKLEMGGMVLALREGVEDPSLFEVICPTCAYRDKLVSPLHGNSASLVLFCNGCDARFSNARRRPRNPSTF